MALAALRAGHCVVGTGRNIEFAAKNSPEFERLGGRWLQLDVSQPEAQRVVEDFLAAEVRLSLKQNPIDAGINRKAAAAAEALGCCK